MVQVINRFTPYRDLHKNVVLADIGCGYGPFTIALHLTEKLQSSTGLDSSVEYIDKANKLVYKLNQCDISFRNADMVKTSNFIQEAYILVISNYINYLTTPQQYKQALHSFYQALKAGGTLVILTPNRMFYREAFTQLIGVQFMPKFLANWYVRYRNKRDTYADIRLPSPFALRYWLRWVGFFNVLVIDAYNFNTHDLKCYFKPRFYITAQRDTK